MAKRSCLDLLRQYMDGEALAELLRLGAGRLPCEYDETSGRFEPALDAIDPEQVADLPVDAVLTACDILTSHRAELDLNSIGRTTGARREISALDFSFAADPEGQAFLVLLQPLAADPDFTIQVGRDAGMVEVRVVIAHHSEHDYQQKVEQVRLLREVARARSRRTPFRGQRL